MSELSNSTAARLTDVHAKLIGMGVRDIKLHKDAERWNSLSMDERANLLCDIFEAWMRGDHSPMPPLNDRASPETRGGPADLVGALQDTVHSDVGQFRAGRAVKETKSNCTGPCRLESGGERCGNCGYAMETKSEPSATIHADGTITRSNADIAQGTGYREAVAEVRRMREGGIEVLAPAPRPPTE